LLNPSIVVRDLFLQIYCLLNIMTLMIQECFIKILILNQKLL